MGKKKRAEEATLWDLYIEKIGTVIGPAAKSMAISRVQDMVGFWFMWHMFGGDKGLRALGYAHVSLWRQHKMFEAVIGVPVEDAWPDMKVAMQSFTPDGQLVKVPRA